MALSAGLNMPIINPNHAAMMEAVYSFRVLHGLDVDAQAYIERFAEQKDGEQNKGNEKAGITIDMAIQKGLKEETRALCKKLLEKEVSSSPLICISLSGYKSFPIRPLTESSSTP